MAQLLFQSIQGINNLVHIAMYHMLRDYINQDVKRVGNKESEKKIFAKIKRSPETPLKDILTVYTFTNLPITETIEYFCLTKRK